MSERFSKQMLEIIPILNQNGYYHARTNGSKFIFVNRVTHRHISVNKKIKKIAILRLIKEYNLEV